MVKRESVVAAQRTNVLALRPELESRNRAQPNGFIVATERNGAAAGTTIIEHLYHYL